MSTIIKSTQLLLLPLVLLLLSNAALAQQIQWDVQMMNGNGYIDGTHSFARVTMGMDPKSDTKQYWYFWVCDKKTGELVKKARVLRNPRAGSVSDLEAETLDEIKDAKTALKITVRSPTVGNELSGPDEDPNVEDCTKEEDQE